MSWHTSTSPEALPGLPGTYALLLYKGRAGRIRVGRLGTFQFPAGWYVYVGSARGPGGLRARLTHHWQPARSPHWHLDFLRQQAVPIEVGWKTGARRVECAWARMVGCIPGAALAVERFGSSDCRCPTHLWYFGVRPNLLRLLAL